MKTMETYIGCKIIRAEEMDEVTFLQDYKGQVHSEAVETRPGYRVVYPDGYVSWSPKDVFEAAYRKVSQGEKEMILPMGG